jgi:hypothetical protein
MKTETIAIMLGILLCGTAQAEWVQYGNHDGSNMYYDPARISKMPNGNVVVWHKQRYSDLQLGRINIVASVRNKAIREKKLQMEHQELIDPKDYSHTLYKYIYDCALQRMATASFYMYSRTGRTIYSGIQTPSEWKFEDVLPDTIEENLMNIVCKKPS